MSQKNYLRNKNSFKKNFTEKKIIMGKKLSKKI